MQKIMFNDRYGLTRAVLEGRKTMTRRVIKAPRTMEGKDVYGYSVVKYPRTSVPIEVMALDADGAQINNILPKFKVGEVVAVAQSYEAIGLSFINPPDKQWGVTEDMSGYRNKMFVRADLMPHQIRITDVRMERLQDISDEDCLREGIRKMTFDTFSFDSWKFFVHNPREAFAALINKISGKGIWKRNPFVYVYEFELLK